MKRKFLIIVVIALSPLFPSLGIAELHQCDGHWTNKSCSGSVGATIEEKLSRSGTDTAPSIEANVAEKSVENPSAQGKCQPTESFVKTRNEPMVMSQERIITTAGKKKTIEVTGVVSGQGRVSVEIKASGKFGLQNRTETKWSESFRFPGNGGEQSFLRQLELQPEWQWEAVAQNIGSFEGYCTTPADEIARAAKNQKFLQQKDHNSSNVVVLGR